MALVQAEKSRYTKWRMGAVLVKGGRVIAAGSNVLRNEPSLAGLPIEECSVHAEAAALQKVSKLGGTMYVARISRSGHQSLARPCKRCRKLLIEAGIRTVVWTIDEESFGISDYRDDSSADPESRSPRRTA
jgi:deoxycytidylate deaminase